MNIRIASIECMPIPLELFVDCEQINRICIIYQHQIDQ